MKKVTPLVGVWIEIFKILPMALAKLSLPLWECGLKCDWTAWLHVLAGSLPLWECGLKYPCRVQCLILWSSLPLWECGLKYWVTDIGGKHIRSLPLWECGLKHSPFWSCIMLCRHSLCGSVDWNKKEDCKEYKTIVTPFAGVWIETLVSGENNWC